MANLSKLEQQELKKIFDAANRIKANLDSKSDSVHDVVFHQINVTTDEEDKNTLTEFMDFIKESFEDLELITSNGQLLKEHFISK